MEHNTWFDRVTGGASELKASQLANLSTSTLNRQLAKGTLSSESVIAISRAYGVSAVQGLVSTGYLKPEEASGMTEEQMADSLSDRVLIATLAKRLGEDPDELLDDAGINTGSNVRHLPDRPSDTEDEVEPERYVAKRKKPEPGEGDDDYGPGA